MNHREQQLAAHHPLVLHACRIIPAGVRCSKDRSTHQAVGNLVSELRNKSPLSFPLKLIGGVSIETAGDAAAFFRNLSEDQKERHHWKIAIRMLNTALQEPAYLKAATMSFQTALAMEGILIGPLKDSRS